MRYSLSKQTGISVFLSKAHIEKEVFFRMAMIVEDGVGRLFGKIQNYSWGGYHFIPKLIGLKPEPGITYAEYWMGAHEKAPSQILRTDGTTVALNELIKKQPEKTLGPYMAQKYGGLPFLLKVMDVREMLSIQVHPTKSEAERGFARENEMGVPLDSPERNYKDDNHKPELEVALSDFWLLYGFRPKDQLQEVLDRVPEFHTLQPVFASGEILWTVSVCDGNASGVGECSSEPPDRARSSEIYFWRVRRIFS